MNLKTLSLSIGALALVSAGVYLLHRPAESATPLDPRVGASLAAPSVIDGASRIELRAHGKSLSLVKGPDGSWAVPEYFGLPADFQKISQLADELLRAKIDRFVTASKERIARYELDGSSITFLDKDGVKLSSIDLGKTTENGSRILRFGGDDKAYQARLNLWLDTTPRSWTDSVLLRLNEADIARLELNLGEGNTLSLSREKKEEAFGSTSLPPDKSLRKDKLDSLLSSLGNLRFTETTAIDDPKAAEATAAGNSRIIKLTTFDGKTYAVTLARKPEQKILKAPKPPADPAKAGPAAALGDAAKALSAPKEQPGKPEADLTETIPAGPVFVSISASDAAAPVNDLMKRRAYQVTDYTFTQVPSKLDDLLEDAKPAPPTAPPPTK